MAEFLIEEAQAAVVPGSEFGAEGFIRLSYAISLEHIEKGLERIEAALARLGAP
jgi:aspartate aminotransferase